MHSPPCLHSSRNLHPQPKSTFKWTLTSSMCFSRHLGQTQSLPCTPSKFYPPSAQGLCLAPCARLCSRPALLNDWANLGGGGSLLLTGTHHLSAFSVTYLAFRTKPLAPCQCPSRVPIWLLLVKILSTAHSGPFGLLEILLLALISFPGASCHHSGSSLWLSRGNQCLRDQKTATTSTESGTK